MFRQYALRCGELRRVGWLDHEPRLRHGPLVSLKDSPLWWHVELAGTVALSQPPDGTWQVGGIVGRMTLPRQH